MKRLSATALLVLLAARSASAENWPGFRGPTGQGISSEKNLPLKWSRTDGGKGENIAWRVPVPGVGHSSPIVWGDKVFLTATSSDGVACRVLCFNRGDGKLSWDREVFKQEPKRKEARNTHATPTPVTDGEKVYAFFGGGGAAAVTADGKVAWTNTDYPFYSRHGFGASPVLYKDTVIMPYDGSTPTFSNIEEERVGWQKPWEKSFILALDAKTGKERWKAGRGMSRIAHVTPKVAEVDGKPQLVSAAGDVIQGHNPETGRLLWTARSQGEGVVPSVVVGLDTKDGKVVWQERLPGGTFAASPVWAEGRLYCLSEAGETVVISAAREFKVLQQNPLNDPCQASPAVSEGQIFIRAAGHLNCIGKRKKSD
jgi:outer membrane protein assembly factor BamB